MAIRCFGMKGLLGFPPPYGFDYSAGMDTLSAKLSKIPGVTCDRIYGWTESSSIVQAILRRPANEGIVVFGHSMGANMIPSIVSSFKRSVAVVASFDATIWYPCPPITPNVHRAISIQGTNWGNIVGHQHLNVVDPTKTRLDKYETNVIHQNIDDVASLHDLVVTAVQAAL